MRLDKCLYYSPEKLENIQYNRGNKLDVESDIWSMGVIYYEMLFNQFPFAHTGINVTQQINSLLESMMQNNGANLAFPTGNNIKQE